MSVREVSIAAFVVAVALAACLRWLNPTAPSNQEFKHSGSQKQAQAYLDAWGSAGQHLARTNLALDWIFIVVYGTFWISAALALSPRANPILHFSVLIFAGTGIAGAVFDLTENICLYLMLHGNASPAAPAVCNVVSRINVGLFFLTLAGMAAAAIAAFINRT